MKGYEHGKSHRRVPTNETHWSFDDFKDFVNRADHGLTSRRARKPTWTPDKVQIEQAVRLLGCTQDAAIAMLRAAHQLKK